MSRQPTAPPLEIDKHCVFRCGSFWFALPASALREVAPRPPIASVPLSAPSLLGLCQLRSEFLPVLSLPSLLATEAGWDASAGEQMLVIAARNAPWAIVVDAVAALESLEVSINTDCRSDDAWTSATLGSATCRGHIVRVLDPNAVYELAANLLAAETPDAATGAMLLNS